MNTNDDPLLDPEEAAAYYKRDKRTMDNDRSRGEGPDYVKFGRSVRYRKSALDRHIEMSTIRLDGNSASPELSKVVLGNPSLPARVARELHVSTEIAQRHINNALRVIDLAGG